MTSTEELERPAWGVWVDYKIAPPGSYACLVSRLMDNRWTDPEPQWMPAQLRPQLHGEVRVMPYLMPNDPLVAVNALPELVARVKRLEARVAELETPTMQWNPDDPEVPIESVEALAEHFADYGHPCGVFEVQNAHELPYTYHFYNVMETSEEIDDDEPIETYEVVCREITKEEYKAGQVAAAVGWFAKRAKWATDRARAALNQEGGQ